MKIVVIGGSGLIGSKVVARLKEKGHETVAASPNTGVNTLTGEGLADALNGADAVVDVSNAPSWEDAAVMDFFTTSTRNLLSAEGGAGVGHHVVLSVVGSDRLPDSGYLRAKVAQEKLVTDSKVPYTLVRATQFFEFVQGIIDGATDGNTVRLAPVLVQPIAADDVAPLVADAALAPPNNGIVDIAGPERAPFNEIIARYLKAVGDARQVVREPGARYWGGLVDDRSLVPLGEARLGHITLEEWLHRAKAAA